MSQRDAVQAADAPRRTAEPAARSLLLFAAFAAVSLLVYRAALHGPFLSDDFGYIVSNPYTSALAWENLRAILDPFGPARLYTANYAPVHLLLTALERQIFADDPFGYHVVNVLLHRGQRDAAGGAAARVGAAGGGGAGGGRRVPAASGERRGGGLGLAAQERGGARLRARRAAAASAPARGGGGAVRARPAHQGLGGLRLADGVRARLGAPPRRRAARAARLAWLALWGLLLAAFALPEYASFAGAGEAEIHRVRGRGRAAAHDRRDRRALPRDGRDLVRRRGLPGARARALLARSLLARGDARWPPCSPGASRRTLRARKPEAAWWIGAAAAWAPVSQVFPFLNPIADRYLYFMLPGLIGGASLWLASALRPAALRRAAVRRRRRRWRPSSRSGPPSGRASGATRRCCCSTPPGTTPTARRRTI